jgi:hypothetical protein
MHTQEKVTKPHQEQGDGAHAHITPHVHHILGGEVLCPADSESPSQKQKQKAGRMQLPVVRQLQLAGPGAVCTELPAVQNRG